MQILCMHVILTTFAKMCTLMSTLHVIPQCSLLNTAIYLESELVFPLEYYNRDDNVMFFLQNSTFSTICWLWLWFNNRCIYETRVYCTNSSYSMCLSHSSLWAFIYLQYGRYSFCWSSHCTVCCWLVFSFISLVVLKVFVVQQYVVSLFIDVIQLRLFL